MELGEPLTRVHEDEIVLSVDRALPEVYGYLLHRCGSRSLAEDLTSEAVLAAVDQVRRGTLHEITAPYLVGIARHKLVDHWRRDERERRRLTSYVPDEMFGATVRVGRIVTFTMALHMGDAGGAANVEVVSEDQFRQTLVNIVDRAESALAGTPKA